MAVLTLHPPCAPLGHNAGSASDIYMNMYIIIITCLDNSGWCFPSCAEVGPLPTTAMFTFMGFYGAKLLCQMPFLTQPLLVAFYNKHDVTLVLF